MISCLGCEPVIRNSVFRSISEVHSYLVVYILLSLSAEVTTKVTVGLFRASHLVEEVAQLRLAASSACGFTQTQRTQLLDADKSRTFHGMQLTPFSLIKG